MTRNILITGGSGFIGTNLVEYFRNAGERVISLDINEPRNPAHKPLWYQVNLLDRENLISTINKFQPDVVLHFGARTDLNEKKNLEGYDANIQGVCNLLEAIRGSERVERVIIASSQLVCEIGYQPENEYIYRPTTLYGKSKVLTENIIRIADWRDITWTIVRPTSLWGPWFGVPYKNFFETIRREIYVHPGGIITRKQWGFVGNSVYQITRLLDVPFEKVHQKTMYLADYEPLDLHLFANSVQQAFDSKPCLTVDYPFLKLIARIGDFLKFIGWQIHH